METRDEIFPLGRIVERYWKTLLAFAALSGSVATVLNFAVLPVRYGSTALLLIVSERLDLAFDPKFRTLPDDRLDLTARRRTLEVLSTSPPVVETVFERVKSKLPPEDRNLIAFQKRLESFTTGEVLSLHALAGDPDLAADVANHWSDALRDATNVVTASRNLDVKVAEEQTKQALQKYATVQSALVGFVQQDRAAMLEGKLRLKRSYLGEMQRAALRLQRSQRDVEQMSAELRADGSGATPVSLPGRLALVVMRLNTLESLGGADVTYAPAGADPLVSMGSMGTAVNMHVELNGETGFPKDAAGFVHELENMASSLKRRVEDMDKKLADPSLSKEILDLQGEVERMTGAKRELVGARDVAWDTYVTLARKSAEARLAAEVGGWAIRMFSRAVADRSPEQPRWPLNIFLSTVGGLLAGLVWVCVGPARRSVLVGMPASAPPVSPHV